MVSYILAFVIGMIVGEIGTVFIVSLCKMTSDDSESEVLDGED